MLILLIIALFFILHIQFLSEVIIWERRDFSFFNWDFYYPYSKDIATKSLVFAIYCLSAFLIGYFLFRRRRQIIFQGEITARFKQNIIRSANIFLLLFIILGLYILIASEFSYSEIIITRKKYNFLFELRVIPLLLTSYVLLNSAWIDWKKKSSKRLKCLLVIYCIILVFLQTRSILFEIGVIFLYYWVRKTNDKFKIRYIILLYLASLVPNILLLYRIKGLEINNIETYRNIFVYEYSLLFNNILSEVIAHTEPMLGKTLSNILPLLIPSFLRNNFGLFVDKTYITNVAHEAGVFGGGFSFLAELYLNFGYWSIAIFLFLGIALAFLNNKTLYIEKVSIFYAGTPLFYCYFVLAFRNDLTVFIKQIIQLFIILFFLKIIFSTKYRWYLIDCT
jgi:oligosaccharide repeat unit polymerase